MRQHLQKMPVSSPLCAAGSFIATVIGAFSTDAPFGTASTRLYSRPFDPIPSYPGRYGGIAKAMYHARIRFRPFTRTLSAQQLIS